MKLEKNDNEIVMRLKCHEYTAVFGAIRLAASDTSMDSVRFFGCERGALVTLFNLLAEEDKRLTRTD